MNKMGNCYNKQYIDEEKDAQELSQIIPMHILEIEGTQQYVMYYETLGKMNNKDKRFIWARKVYIDENKKWFWKKKEKVIFIETQNI